MRVTKELVETPAEKIDPQLVMKETNAEVRREIVDDDWGESVGDKYLSTSARSNEPIWEWEGDERDKSGVIVCKSNGDLGDSMTAEGSSRLSSNMRR